MAKREIKLWCVFFFSVRSFIHGYPFPPNQRTIFSILMDFCHVNTKLCFIFTFPFAAAVDVFLVYFFSRSLQRAIKADVLHEDRSQVVPTFLIVGLAKSYTKNYCLESFWMAFSKHENSTEIKFHAMKSSSVFCFMFLANKLIAWTK